MSFCFLLANISKDNFCFQTNSWYDIMKCIEKKYFSKFLLSLPFLALSGNRDANLFFSNYKQISKISEHNLLPCLEIYLHFVTSPHTFADVVIYAHSLMNAIVVFSILLFDNSVFSISSANIFLFLNRILCLVCTPLHDTSFHGRDSKCFYD